MTARFKLLAKQIQFCAMSHKLAIPRQRNSGIVLSLTSIKERLNTIHLPIFHLLQDGFEIDHLEIWLAHDLKSQITKELNLLESKGCCLNFIDDIGPATKLLYCVEKHPNSNIITIDDDVFLSPGALRQLSENAKIFPDVVICNMARRIALGEDGTPLPYRQWNLLNRASQHPEFDILPLGHGGVLYPANVLNPICRQISLMKQLCPFGDDLWFMAMRLLNEKRAFATNISGYGRTRLPEAKWSSIKARTSAQGNNDSSIRRLFEYFSLSQKLRQLANQNCV